MAVSSEGRVPETLLWLTCPWLPRPLLVRDTLGTPLPPHRSPGSGLKSDSPGLRGESFFNGSNLYSFLIHNLNPKFFLKKGWAEKGASSLGHVWDMGVGDRGLHGKRWEGNRVATGHPGPRTPYVMSFRASPC